MVKQSADHLLTVLGDLLDFSRIEHGRIEVAFQPVFRLRDGHLTGYEALARWQHPDHGMVSPAEFIPIAETTGQIIAIGEWVFQQACHQVADWRLRLDPAFQVSVNKSPVQCQHKVAGHPSWAGQMLAQRFGLGPSDTCYLSMPLFHSNAVMAGWAPAVAGRCGRDTGSGGTTAGTAGSRTPSRASSGRTA